MQKYLDITKEYTEDDEFVMNLWQLTALTFFPPKNVATFFDLLMETPFFEENEEILRPLIDYF